MPVIEVAVPPGLAPGQQFVVEFAGQRVGVQVPPGVVAGQKIRVQAPDPPAAPPGEVDLMDVEVAVPDGVAPGAEMQVQTPAGGFKVQVRRRRRRQ